MARAPNLGRGTTPGVAHGLAVLLPAFVGAAAALSSCILVRGRGGDRIFFPLDPHLDVIDDCNRCHEDVAGHDVTAETRRALEQACFECHGDRRQDCGYCHSDVASAGRFPEKERHLAFSHENHLERVHGDCLKCHEPAHAPDGATEMPHPTFLPSHPECFSCHEMQQLNDRMECTTCHEALFEYGLKPYEEFSHSTDWLHKAHGEFMRSPQSASVCAQCHGASFCSDCHAVQPLMTLAERRPERVHRSFIHAGDYTFRHMWDARADPASCTRCHSQSDCNDCHDRRGITERTAARTQGGFRFHGPGVLVPGSPDYHGTAARRDILSCAACHAEGMRGNCVACHAVGAFGGNPHPPGFSSRLSRTGAPVCRICHVR